MHFGSVLAALAVVLSCLACHCGEAADTNAAPRTPPPALAEPLLLLDDTPATNAPAAKMADNTRCQVCHLNLAMEEMTLTHARAEIGCAKCHGASDHHIADESWASGGNGTAPEIMYPKYKINGFCRACHNGPNETKKTGPPCPKLAGAWTAKKFCTECHGKHRLPERKCKWK
jgi:hypothetical protein